MNSSKIKIALIGCGGIGEYHLSHLVEFPDVELVGFCDVIVERAENFVSRTGSGRAYDHYTKLLEHESPDGVFLCVPPYAHGEIEFALIERDIHMFVEKPVALDIELAKQIRDAAEAKNLITAVGFQCRYSSLVDEIQPFLTENEVVQATCIRIGGIPETPWWPDKQLSGGQMVEQTIHNVDLIRYHLGEPDQVFSFATRGYIDGGSDYATDDASVAVIKFKSGAIASIMTGCYGESGAAADNKITFSAKSARADVMILDRVNVYGMAEAAVIEAEAEEDEGGFLIKSDGGFRGDDSAAITYRESLDAGVVCDRTFVDALISGDGSKIRSTYRDGLRSVALTLACNMSIDTGEMIRFDDLDV